MKEQQQNNDEVIQSPTIESQPGEVFDISPVTQQLEELINIISSELELKKKKEQEEEKKIQENEKILETELATQEEKEELFWTGYNTMVTNSNTQLVTLEEIKAQNQEMIFLGKMSFVGLGVFISLICILIFQISFKR